MSDSRQGNRELDARIAVNLFGWIWWRNPGGYFDVSPGGYGKNMRVVVKVKETP